MEKTLLILRICLVLIVAWCVYNETGIFTTLALLLVYGGDEYYNFNAGRIVKRLDKLRDLMQMQEDRNKENREALARQWDELTSLINKKVFKP